MVPPPEQPPPHKIVNTSQASGVSGLPPILKNTRPMATGIVLLGDSTLKEEKIIDIVRNYTLVMSPESEHVMPNTRVINLCSSGHPMKVEQIMYHEATVTKWAKFRPTITILQIGTIDLVTGSLGEYPLNKLTGKQYESFAFKCY